MKLLNSFILILATVTHTSFADVRKSGSGICHEKGVSPYYSKTGEKNGFDTLEACLASSNNARLPKGIKPSIKAQNRMSQMDRALNQAKQEGRAFSVPYDRELYPHWRRNVDGCLNMRHALLKATSLVKPVVKDCKVISGKWYGPYTNQYFTRSKDLDLDHVIPLKAGHGFGLHSANETTREAFANDRENLILVDASANRSKGAKSLSEWLPQNMQYRCEYIKRFTQVKNKYKLSYQANEQRVVNRLKKACGI